MMHNSTWRPQRRASRNGLLLTIILVTLVFFNILGGTGLDLLMFGQSQSNVTPKITSTGKSVLSSGQTPQQLYTHITNTLPAFTDPLTHDDMLLWTGTDQKRPLGCASHSAQGLDLQVPDASDLSILICLAYAPNLSDFAFQVKMTIIRGSEGGLVFRANMASSPYSFFTVSQGGVFSVLTYGNPLSTLLHRTDPAIKVGPGQTNVLTMIALGPTFLLYANSHYLGQLTDTKIPANGYIGLAAYGVKDPSEAIFSDMRVWKL